MFCCISHRPAAEPVASKVCGCVFEESLIKAYIDEHGCCPVTGEPLAHSDLIKLHTSETGKLIHFNDSDYNNVDDNSNLKNGQTNIAYLLTQFRDEWSAIMLEQFEMRKRIAHLEQELSFATERYEAACHVIAKLNSELESSNLKSKV